MSGDVINDLRDPVVYPHWMWVAGLVVLLAVIAWIGLCLWRWWTSDETRVPDLQTITAARRARYHELASQIRDRRADGELDDRGTHLAIAGLMRALGTERTGRDLEVATVAEVRRLVPMWPQLADVLEACEAPSFTGRTAAQGVDEEYVEWVLQLAHEAVDA